MAVTVNAVQGLLGDHFDCSVDLKPFIDAATILMQRVIECAKKKGKPLTQEEIDILTMWLAAHLYGSTDQFYQSRQTGRASGTFMGKSELGLDGTLFGQNAKLLDPSNCLRAIDAGGLVGFEWLGKPPSQQIPIWERD